MATTYRYFVTGTDRKGNYYRSGLFTSMSKAFDVKKILGKNGYTNLVVMTEATYN